MNVTYCVKKVGKRLVLYDNGDVVCESSDIRNGDILAALKDLKGKIPYSTNADNHHVAVEIFERSMAAKA